MSIVCHYRVTVEVPEEVWAVYGNTPEWDRKVSAAFSGNIESGSSAYCEVYEWATFLTYNEALTAEMAMLEVIKNFRAKLEEKDRE